MRTWANEESRTFIEKWRSSKDPCTHFAGCVKTIYKPPLLKNIRTKMIDPDTEKKYYTKLAKDGKTKLDLVVRWVMQLSIKQMLNFASSLMNSILQGELSTMEMIHTFKLLISGMVLLVIWNGMIQML